MLPNPCFMVRLFLGVKSNWPCMQFTKSVQVRRTGSMNLVQMPLSVICNAPFMSSFVGGINLLKKRKITKRTLPPCNSVRNDLGGVWGQSFAGSTPMNRSIALLSLFNDTVLFSLEFF